MSKGEGKVERAILEGIAQSPTPVTFESLRWDLYPRLRPPLAANADLPGPFNTSVDRAFGSLEVKGRIRVTRRRLESLDECVEHFPGKSLQGPMRSMRRELLPALKEWKDEGSLRPRFGTAENEEYLVSKFGARQTTRLKKQWQGLESLIRPHFALSGADDLFELMLKGRSLFCGLEAECRTAFAEAMERCCSGLLPPDVVGALRTFAGEFMSAAAADRLTFQSLLHEFAKMHNQGRWTLKRETMNELHVRRRVFVEGLPDFQPPVTGMRSWMKTEMQCKSLDKLFDQSVLQEFKFVELV